MNGTKIIYILIIGGIALLGFFGVRASIVSDDKSTREELRDRSSVQPAQDDAVETVTDEDASVKKFVMTARQWAFEPSEIRVKKGDHVELTITSEDVLHSFYVVMGDEEINGFLEPGKTTIVEFDVNTSGSFVFACLVQCGAGHPNMRGTLIVEE